MHTCLCLFVILIAVILYRNYKSNYDSMVGSEVDIIQQLFDHNTDQKHMVFDDKYQDDEELIKEYKKRLSQATQY